MIIMEITKDELKQMIADAVAEAVKNTQQQTKFVKGAKAAAELLGVSERTIARRAKPSKFGRQNYYNVETLLN